MGKGAVCRENWEGGGKNGVSRNGQTGEQVASWRCSVILAMGGGERDLGEVEFGLGEVVEAGRSWVLWAADWVVEGKEEVGRRGRTRRGVAWGWRGRVGGGGRGDAWFGWGTGGGLAGED